MLSFLDSHILELKKQLKNYEVERKETLNSLMGHDTYKQSYSVNGGLAKIKFQQIKELEEQLSLIIRGLKGRHTKVGLKRLFFDSSELTDNEAIKIVEFIQNYELPKGKENEKR